MRKNTTNTNVTTNTNNDAELNPILAAYAFAVVATGTVVVNSAIEAGVKYGATYIADKHRAGKLSRTVCKYAIKPNEKNLDKVRDVIDKEANWIMLQDITAGVKAQIISGLFDIRGYIEHGIVNDIPGAYLENYTAIRYKLERGKYINLNLLDEFCKSRQRLEKLFNLNYVTADEFCYTLLVKLIDKTEEFDVKKFSDDNADNGDYREEPTEETAEETTTEEEPTEETTTEEEVVEEADEEELQ